MKRILLAGVGVLALASLANAADLPRQMYTKAPPPMVAPYYNWTGFYLGINGGGAWGTSNWSSTGDFDVSGGMIGGTIAISVFTAARLKFTPRVLRELRMKNGSV